MTHEQYIDYIQSDGWRQKREEYILVKKPTQCGSCNRPFQHYFNLHHITYKNLGNEKLEDLIMLCSSCHRKLHDSLKEARRLNPYLKVETHTRRFLELMAISRGDKPIPRPQRPKRKKKGVHPLHRRKKSS